MSSSSYWRAFQSFKDDSQNSYSPPRHQSPYSSSQASDSLPSFPLPLPPPPPMHSSYSEGSQRDIENALKDGGWNEGGAAAQGEAGGSRKRSFGEGGSEREGSRAKRQELRGVEGMEGYKGQPRPEMKSFEDMLGGRVGARGDGSASAQPSASSSYAASAPKQSSATFSEPNYLHLSLDPELSQGAQYTSLDALLAASTLPDLLPPHADELVFNPQPKSRRAASLPHSYYSSTTYCPLPQPPHVPLPPRSSPSSSASTRPRPISIPPDCSLWQDWRADDDDGCRHHSSPTSSTYSVPSATQHSPLTPPAPNHYFAPDVPLPFYPQWTDFSFERNETGSIPRAPSPGLSQLVMPETGEQLGEKGEQSAPLKKLRTKRCDGGRQGPPLDEAKRVYKCGHQGCGKAFARPSALTTHKRSHSKEKPFVCPLPTCRRAFTVFSNLKRRTKIHPEVDYSGVTSADYETNRIQEVVEVASPSLLSEE